MKREEPRTIELRREDGRHYTIILGPTLLYPNAFRVVQGGRTRPARERTEEFVTRDQLVTRWRLLIGARRRRGYKEITR